MIRFEGASKHYPGAARPAVDALDLTVSEGAICALLGPSGCGKSTSLRMVNRLVDPDAGRVLLAGKDVARTDPIALRRGIGYVLQGIGLFPHRNVAQNVATVPELLGWPHRRVSERVDAMLDLVGLDPATFAKRRPDALSGGQRQRVGVARALAADPPVLLMDEPFGAVDPVARTRLQVEIGSILRRLRKTVILVTHDIGEALTLSDQIAVMREGKLVQADTPAGLLAQPVDDFVARFLGEDRALRRLALFEVGTAAFAGTADGGPSISPHLSLKDALAIMLASGATRLALDEAGGERVISLDAVRAAARAEAPLENPDAGRV